MSIHSREEVKTNFCRTKLPLQRGSSVDDHFAIRDRLRPRYTARRHARRKLVRRVCRRFVRRNRSWYAKFVPWFVADRIVAWTSHTAIGSKSSRYTIRRVSNRGTRRIVYHNGFVIEVDAMSERTCITYHPVTGGGSVTVSVWTESSSRYPLSDRFVIDSDSFGPEWVWVDVISGKSISILKSSRVGFVENFLKNPFDSSSQRKITDFFKKYSKLRLAYRNPF